MHSTILGPEVLKMTEGTAAMLVYTTKECSYNSIVIVHQHGAAMTSHANQRICTAHVTCTDEHYFVRYV